MKKCFFNFCFLFFLCIPSSHAAKWTDEEPVWSQINELICQGGELIRCEGVTCTSIKSKALWKVDFRNSNIKYISIAKSEVIQGRFFKYYPFGSVNAVFIEGRMMKFFFKEINIISNTPVFKAVTVDHTSVEGKEFTSTTNFECIVPVN